MEAPLWEDGWPVWADGSIHLYTAAVANVGRPLENKTPVLTHSIEKDEDDDSFYPLVNGISGIVFGFNSDTNLHLVSIKSQGGYNPRMRRYEKSWGPQVMKWIRGVNLIEDMRGRRMMCWDSALGRGVSKGEIVQCTALSANGTFWVTTGKGSGLLRAGENKYWGWV